VPGPHGHDPNKDFENSRTRACIDEEHEARGFKAMSDHFMAASFAPSEKTVTVEMANAHEGFSLIAGKTLTVKTYSTHYKNSVAKRPSMRSGIKIRRSRL